MSFVMRTSSFRRLSLRWSLLGCFAAMLAMGAFLGGRRMGFESAYAEAFAAQREIGLAAGKEYVDREIAARYARFGQRYETYPVGPLIAKRLGVDPAEKLDDETLRVEFEKLIAEIREEFAPDSVSDQWTTEEMERMGFARRRNLSVTGDGWQHAGIARYLASKEDYMKWKLEALAR